MSLILNRNLTLVVRADHQSDFCHHNFPVHHLFYHQAKFQLQQTHRNKLNQLMKVSQLVHWYNFERLLRTIFDTQLLSSRDGRKIIDSGGVCQIFTHVHEFSISLYLVLKLALIIKH